MCSTFASHIIIGFPSENRRSSKICDGIVSHGTVLPAKLSVMPNSPQTTSLVTQSFKCQNERHC